MADFTTLTPTPLPLGSDRLIGTRGGIAITTKVSSLADVLAALLVGIPRDTYPNSAQTNVPRGIIGHGVITAGSAGTNGVFALAFTGGNFAVNPTGTFTVSGGALTSITFATPGEYIGASPTAPTLSFTASTGLTGASATATVGFLVANGARYWTLSTDGLSLKQYQNVVGVATAVSPAITMATAAGVSALIAQVDLEADRADAAANLAASYLQEVTGIYDPISEFSVGSNGAYAVVELEYLFTDTAGTVAATGVNDVIKCWKPRYTTSVSYEQIQADSSKAPVLKKMGDLWYLDYANGKGMYSRANVSLRCPQQILFAGSFEGVTTQAFFGYVKNTNAAFYMSSYSNDTIRTYAHGASDIVRPLTIASTADFTSPPKTVAVYHAAMTTGSNNAKFEMGLDKPGNSPIATTWVNGDTVSSMSLSINCTSQSAGIGVPNSNASCKCFGWMVIDKAFSNVEGVVNYFQNKSTVVMRPKDFSVFAITDSTGDDQTVSTEIMKYFAINKLVADNPTKDVYYRIWNRLANCYAGFQPLTPGDRAERIFMTVAASAGSQPSYFTAERFAAMIAPVDHVDRRLVGHGHNLAVTVGNIQAHAQSGLLRLGELIEMEDQLRTQWPNAPVLMQKVHPVRFPGDIRTAPVIAAMDLLQNEIYQDIHFARIDLAFEATGRNTLLYQGDGVHMTEAGVTLAGDTMISAYNAWVLPGTVTPPVLARRRLPVTDIIIPNGLFEDWSGALPAGVTSTAATVTRSVDEQLRGPSMKIVGAVSGDSFVQWDFDPVPYRGKTVVALFWQLIKTGGDQETGRIQAGSNGTNNVGNSWVYEMGIRSTETWEPRMLHLPVPADATTAFFRHWAGSGSTGTVYLDRLILAEGTIPRDVLI